MEWPKKGNEKGFTFIELIIVVAVIGILASIAIPRFTSYRKKAFDSAALSDVKSLKVNFEAYFSEFNEYPTTSTGGITLTQGQFPGISGLSFYSSNGVTVWFESNPSVFIGYAWHENGYKTFGINQKSQKIYFAPNTNLPLGTLEDNLVINQVWQDPWNPI